MSTAGQTVGAGRGDDPAAGAAPAWRRLARRLGPAAPRPAAGSRPSTLHQAGPHFVIAPGDGGSGGPTTLPPALTTALARLEPVVRTVTVLAAAPDAPDVLFERLDELIRTVSARGATALVLAASGLAAAPAEGRRPSEQVAELTGIGIVAPDGVVTLRPDGTLLTTGPEGGVPSSWWLCTPAGVVRRLGPVWPLSHRGGAARSGVVPAVVNAAPHLAPAPIPVAVAPAVPVQGWATAPAGRAVAPAPAPTPTPGWVVAPAPAPAAEAPVPAAPAGPLTSVGAPPPPPAATAPEPVPASAPTPPSPSTDGPASPAAPPGVRTGPVTAETPVPDRPDDLPATPFTGGFRIGLGPDPLAGTPGAPARAEAGEGTLVLLVGRPGEPLPQAHRLAATTRRLFPRPPAGLLLSAPWAPTAALTVLAAGLAAELERDVRVAVGLPQRTAGGFSARVLDADGVPAWEPWLTELTASAGLRRVVASAWRSAPAGLSPCGPALFAAAVPGWLLEAVPAGLWLRPGDPPQDLAPRLLDPDPAGPLLIVGEEGRPVPPDVAAGAGDLVTALAGQGAPAPRLTVRGVASPDATTPGKLDADRPVRPDADAAPDANEDADADAAPDTDPTPDTHPGPDLDPASDVDSASEVDAAPDTDQAPDTVPDAEAAASEAPAPAPGPGQGPETETAPAHTPATAPGPARPFGPETAAAPARPSTAAERAAVKDLLGGHFQRCASHADQVATRLPALRSGGRDDLNELKTDLAAVFLHHADPGAPVSRTELVEAARRPDPGPLDAFLACLGSGLRRLPSHHGAVLLGAHATAEELRHYVPGARLTEPAPVVGLPSHDVELGTPVEFAVWSATGRRTAVFAEEGEHEVVFPPGSHFSVLDVLPGEDGRPTRVLLRETGLPLPRERAEVGLADDDRDQHCRARLLVWLARRDLLAPEERRTPDRPERFLLTPGVAPHRATTSAPSATSGDAT
ncbi:hypothetical protein J5Y04_25675 [Kitasatospora sp. RG8]|uniref:hypothetical protein n=1 Tax=Kitasatospora sp. RG8 TaxID=2820815 RepID=UPI001ADF8ED7|nr:hypothetical protein [Kitasatospora sp. RG8]MBP0452908.1 hypothetical protein [Kitasatospora sp. RG8]